MQPGPVHDANNLLPAEPIDVEADARPAKWKLSRRKKFAVCCSVSVVLLIAVGMIGFFVVGPTIVRGAMARTVITFDELSMDCVVANQSIMVASKITISNVAPLGCSIGAMEVTALFNNRPFALLQMPAMSVDAGVDNHRSTPVHELTITDEAVWTEASSAMLRSKSVTWRLMSQATVSAGVLGMSVTFKNVPFDKEVSFKGFNSFVQDMKVSNLDVTGGDPASSTLDMVADCEVTNPSNIAASMGPLSLELWTAGNNPIKLGELHVPNFALNANAEGTAVTKFSKVRAKYIAPSGASAAASRAFLSSFTQGSLQSVSIRGTAASSPVKHLQAAMVNFTMASAVPGLGKHNLLLRGLMHIPDIFTPYNLPTQLVVQNPFSAPMLFQRSNCDIYPCKVWADDNTCKEYYAESSGIYTKDQINEMVPGKGSLPLKLHDVNLYRLLTPEMIKTAFASLGGGSFINLNGSMALSIAGVPVTVDYKETDVPICLVYPFHSCGKMIDSAVTLV